MGKEATDRGGSINASLVTTSTAMGVVAALPFLWFNEGPVYYYDPLAVYPPGATIYDPQTGMMWVPAHFERVGDSVVWVPARWEPLRRRS